MLCDVDAGLFHKHTASCLAKVKSDITSQHKAVLVVGLLSLKSTHSLLPMGIFIYEFI